MDNENKVINHNFAKAPDLSDVSCPICKEPTKGIGPVENISFGQTWRSDTILELMKWSSIKTQLRMCLKCTHTAIFPKFNTSPIYSSNFFEVQTQARLRFKLNNINTSVLASTVFKASSLDFRRFELVSSYIGKVIGDNKDFHKKEFKILDWGGGDGYVSKQIAHAMEAVSSIKASVEVYDPVTWNVNDKKEKLEQLESHGYDLIIVSHVLEHLDDPVATLEKCKELLNPEGVLLVEVPDERTRLVNSMLGGKTGLQYHVGHFSCRSLSRAINSAGLKCKKVNYQLSCSYRGKRMPTIIAAGVHGNNGVEYGQGREYVSFLLRVLVEIKGRFVNS